MIAARFLSRWETLHGLPLTRGRRVAVVALVPGVVVLTALVLTLVPVL